MRPRLPARHPFRKIDNIFQFREFNEAWDGEEIPSAFWPRKPRFESLMIPEADYAFKYIGNSQLHDSPISSMKMDGNLFEIELIEFDAWRLSTALRGEIKMVAPTLTIKFENVSAFKVCKSDWLGHLRELDKTARKSFQHARDFNHEWIMTWSDRKKQIAIAFHNDYPSEIVKAGGLNPHCEFQHCPALLILIEFEKIVFIERQRESLVAEFGEEAGEIYDLMDVNRSLFVHSPFFVFEDLVSDRKLTDRKEWTWHE